MNDLVEVGAFAGGEEEEPLYLKRHHLTTGKQRIQFTVPSKPMSVGLDPYKKMLERERNDNGADVQ